MEFKIDKNVNGTEMTLIVSGKLTSATSCQLFDAVSTLDETTTKLTFDFKNLEYISSSGIRVLFEAKKRLKGDNKIEIINCNDAVMEVFTITSLINVFNIKR